VLVAAAAVSLVIVVSVLLVSVASSPETAMIPPTLTMMPRTTRIRMMFLRIF
jgi:hypothetical protein